MVAETHDAQADATVIRELTRLADENLPFAVIDAPDGRTFTVSRSDFKVEDKTLPNAATVLMPKIVTAAVVIDTATSLINYVNRFKNPNTVLFASEEDRKVVAVIDYHGMPDANLPQPNAEQVPPAAPDRYLPSPRLCQQIATLTLKFDDRWTTWVGNDENLMPHRDFATFLEENQFDVTKPSGADLLEICRDLQVKEGVEFSSSIRMGDTVSVTFQKEGDATTKSNMAIPVSFETTIPVFFGEGSVKVLNWTRRKIGGGQLSLGYKMSQRKLTVANEFARIVGEIRSGVGDLTTVYGRRQA